MTQAEEMMKEATAILQSVPALATRRSELEDLQANANPSALYVGVIGITSSGKSTFINALMGDPLLPEEGRVTTNLIVKCYFGATREATVYFTDRRQPLILRGPALTAQRLALLCSETGNPANQAGVSCIELTTPTSCIPRGMTFIDTPGLDGAGHQKHQDITLRQAIPMADIVVYMTSIRNPFKRADLHAVATLLEYDQRALFLLTQIDLERDSYEGGTLIKSREEKIIRHRQRLESDLSRIKGLRSYGVELVSSWWAKQGFEDRNGDSWARSGLARVLTRLDELAAELKDTLDETRVTRVRVLLERTLKELEQATHAVRPRALASRPNRHARIEQLRGGLNRLRATIEHTMDLIHQRADHWRLHKQIELDSSSRWSVEAAQTLFRNVEDELTRTREAVVAATDHALAALRAELGSLAIVPARSGEAHRRLLGQRLESAEQFVVTEEQTVRTRGWFDDLCFWPKSETRLVRRYSGDEARSELKRFVSDSCAQANEFSQWWRNYVTNVYIQPVQVALETERTAASDLDTLIANAAHEASCIDAARIALTSLLGKNKNPIVSTRAVVPGTGEVRPPHQAVTSVHVGTALQPLIARFRELEFRRTLGRRIREVSNGTGPIVALGRDRSPHLRLLALLAHDLRLSDQLATLPNDCWITTGDVDMGLPGPIRRIDVPNPFAVDHPMVIAPDDERLSECDWARFLSSYSVLLIEIDAPRIGAGMSDLARAPYRSSLPEYANRLLFTCGNGAIFAKNRLGEVIRDVVPELTRDFGRAPLFVYEDYDVRHSRLLELYADALRSGNPRQLVRQWRDAGLHFGPPFTESALHILAVELDDQWENNR